MTNKCKGCDVSDARICVSCKRKSSPTSKTHDNTINVSVQSPVINFKKLHPDAVIPTRATDGSAGFDLHIHSLEYEPDYDTVKIGCGVAAGIPAGYVGLLSVRSSTYKYGLELVNQIGVVDSDFVYEIFIRLKSNELAPDAAFPETGTRIAQMVVVPFLGEAVEVDELPITSRTGGCGSTGK